MSPQTYPGSSPSTDSDEKTRRERSPGEAQVTEITELIDLKPWPRTRA
jgi:hypothetical protein